MVLSQEYRENWSTGSKIIFRFFFLYFGLYILFRFLGIALFGDFFIWVGHSILNLKGRLEYFPTGSGDTTLSYVRLFVQTASAIVGTVIWSIIDRKRTSYNKLLYWFLVLVRIFLIFFLLSYGFAKIYKTQFPNPSLNRLLQPVGEMSPMGLAWTYMGHSVGFNLVVGFFEALGGFLLIPRRTQTFGAFVAAGVMFQVVLMNLFFDIPVKIFSFHLFLMAVFIFSTDARRFAHIFIKNKATQVYEFYNPIKDKRYHKIIFWVKLCGILILVGFMSFDGYSRERGTYGDKREKPALYGIWEVEQFVRNQDTIPPLLTDHTRWRYLIVDWKDRAVIQTMNGSKEYIDFVPDSTLTKAKVTSYNWSKEESFTISNQDSMLSLQGKIYNNDISITFKKKKLSQFELLNRGFHWVNEYAHNR